MAQCVSKSMVHSSASIFATARTAGRILVQLTQPIFSPRPPGSSGCPGKSMFVSSIFRKQGTQEAFAPSAVRHFHMHRQRCSWFRLAAWILTLPSPPMRIFSRQAGLPGITASKMHRVLRHSHHRRHLTVRETGSAMWPCDLCDGSLPTRGTRRHPCRGMLQSRTRYMRCAGIADNVSSLSHCHTLPACALGLECTRSRSLAPAACKK